jgi:hypothetical protein
MITLRLLLWLVPIGLNTWADANGRKPNYIIMFILRGVALILYGTLWVDEILYTFQDWLPVIFVFIYCMTSFWILFELALNVIYNIREGENRSLLYFDQKEGDSGWIDRFFKRNPQLHTIAKVISLILMIVSIVFIYRIYG